MAAFQGNDIRIHAALQHSHAEVPSMISDVADRIAAMRTQETARYACPDYLRRGEDGNDAEPPRPADGPDQMFDEHCREQICQWFFRVVDHFSISREVVSIAMSYLDRFLSSVACNRRMFKLAATSSLYLAVKTHEPKLFYALAAVLPELIRGEFTTRHIIEMERLLLRNLSWLVNPPTAISFARHYLALVPSYAHAVLGDVSEFALFLAQLTSFDYFFVTKRPSSVAVAAVLNALDSAGGQDLDHSLRYAIFQAIANVVPDIIEDFDEILSLRARLRTLYERNGDPGLSQTKCTRVTNRSPVSVMQEGRSSSSRSVARVA